LAVMGEEAVAKRGKEADYRIRAEAAAVRFSGGSSGIPHNGLTNKGKPGI